MAQQNTPPASSQARTATPQPSSGSKLVKSPVSGLQGAKKPIAKKPINVASIPFWLGLLVSIMWVGAVILIVAASGPEHTFGGLPLASWAIGISAIASPVALIWMVTAYLQRAADIQSVAEPLRRQLSIITGESGIAEARVRRFNQSIREQLDLLKDLQANSHGDFATIIDRVHKSRLELEQFEQSSVEQVREIQDIIRRNMQQVEQLMDDKFTMMRVLDDKLVQTGDSVARQTDSVRDQISKLMEDVENNSQQLALTLERALSDSRKLSDTSRTQESSLIAASESASEILNSVSSKIDLSVARFLERAGTAREEGERLAGVLDTQTRALDEFSTTLPARVSETEVILRGVADRLYSSEELARTQATLLSEKLSTQVDNLQAFLDRFTSRLTDIDGSLGQRSTDLDGIAARVTTTANEFVQVWEKSVTDLSDRSSNALLRFTTINDDTRRSADSVVTQLSETTTKYEDAATRMRALTEESNSELKGMTEQIDSQIKQFDALHQASHKMGEEVEARASAAMQNLQYVLERLLAAREATQTVGETLVKDLFAAVDQNETLISRLNEAAQMSVRALGIATESLVKQESGIVDQTRSAERILQEAAMELQQKAQVAVQGLREQTGNLTSLLAQAQVELEKTDSKIQSFVARSMPPVQEALRQVDAAADQGLQSMGRYGEGLQQQFGRLQDFNANISGMGEDLTRITSETVSTIEGVQSRFVAVRDIQSESARQTLEQFADFADRLQREVGGLDGQAAQAVTLLQSAATRVGEQSYQMLQTAETSGAKIQIIASALQSEATQIRAALQKQADDLSADLSRAEKQFTVLGEAIQQRTDVAYSLLDRVASHYNETTSAASQNLEARTERLSEVTSQVQNRIETLGGSLGQQLTQLSSGSAQLENHAAQIANASGKALQQLSSVNEKLALTHENANRNVQQSIARIEESSTTLLRQSNGISEVAQNSSTLIQKAGAAFGEQTTKMLDQSQATEQLVRQLATTTATMAEQSAQIRSGMEQQNQRLVAQVVESVVQLESSSQKLKQYSEQAIVDADKVATQFSDVTEVSTARLNESSKNMQEIANKTDVTLANMGASITQQTASLSVLSDQLAEQQRTIAAANEGQRQQLVDLFDKLGSAHGQASEVAERTIERLTESLNQIQRQLGMMSDQSQTAVGNVRAASDGFAEKSGVLLQNAQAAEQQARTVLSVTAALQEQARQLRESLHAEGERSGDMLSGLISKLSAGGIELRDLSSTTEMSLTSVSNAVVQQTQGLNLTMQQIGERQRSLVTALDAQRDVMNGLLNRLSLAQDETASVAERTATRLTDGTQQIVRQMESMDMQARTVTASVQAANASFIDESSTLSSHAREAEQQVRQVQATTATLAEQTRQMREVIEGEGQRAGDMLNALINKFVQSGSQVRDVASTTEASLVSLQSGISDQTGEISGTMQQIIERQKVLVSALSEQREVMNSLLNRLSLAQDETASVAERTATRLTDGTQQIVRQMESMDMQARTVTASVQAANASFIDESSTLSSHAREAEQQVRQVQATTATLAEQTRQMREVIEGEGQRAGDMLNALINKFVQSGSQVRDVASTTEASLVSLQSGISDQTGEISGTMQQIIERQKVLVSALSEQREVMNSLLNRLSFAQDETASVAERTVARLTDGTQQMIRQIEGFDSQVKSVLTNVEAANSNFSQEIKVMSAHTRETEQQAISVAAVTSTLHEQMKTIREGMQTEAERASELMTDLVNKLLQSGSQVRDVTTTAEATMTSLNNGLGQQSSDITLSMQQIIERQKVLTAALSEQREMMGSLLSRVALAQDETASATERTVIRLADGAQQIVKQLEAIGSQAQNTLSNVQAAGRGFADEAGTLGMHAQQAEQHMRGVLSVMGGLQDQAQRLREAMQAETAHVVKEMNGVIAQLDSTNMGLKQQSLQSISAMDQSALQFATLAKSSAEAMQRQSELMSEAAQRSEERLFMSGEKIKDSLKLVGEIGSQTELQARQLADVAEYATNRLGALRSTILDSDHEGQNALNQATSRIDEVKSSLQNELQRLNTLSRDAVEQVAIASQQLILQSDALRANLASSESALAEAATLVRDETIQIPAALERTTAQIEAAAHTLKNQAKEADTTLISTADRFISVTGTARESMVDEMRRISSVADSAGEKLRQFTAALAEQVSSMQVSAGTLSTEQQDLVERSGRSVTQMSAASDRLTQLRIDAAATAEKLAREFEIIDQHATSTSERMEKASVSTVKNVEALVGAADRAEAQMLGATTSFRDQLERIRGGLQGQIDDINRGLMQITAQLERTGSTLRSTTAGTVADVERISQRFNETSKEAATQLTDKTERMRGATEEVASLLSGFGDQLDVLLDRLSMAGDGIKRHEGSLIGQMQSALAHLGSVAEKLESGRVLASSVSSETVKRLTEVADAVKYQMGELADGSQAAAGVMRGIGQIYGDQANVLNKGVDNAHGQVQAMNKAIDDMQQRTDRMRVSLKLQGEDLMDALQQILSQLAAAGDAMTNTVDHVLQERAEEGLKKIG